MNKDEKIIRNQKKFERWNEQYERVFDSPQITKKIEELRDILDPFFKEVKIISEKYNINNEHAACYICNFRDEYICNKFNGGCKDYELCEKIRNNRKSKEI